ncbi:hypothetical protein KI809_04365 [Geobacter pelophilus]|uniref:Uncharacterized protein n=1 Tax=Geoanaerobacter pelophilus TaxID=60036 RepID=A0AAW4L1Z9_9BACT|nr:hypothetical protein [Geoanaerobacter pelophilus]MBT0663530.1 hypothetical protein [Geoanaerobacter pelophilus]
MNQTPTTPAACTTCERHADQHPELFKLLNPTQRDNLQISLCVNVDCLVGHEGEWEDEDLERIAKKA